MTELSKSLTLTWEIAAQEAIQSGAEEISPSHLLLGLCKLCDRPIPELEAEIQGLVQRLHDVDPKQLRRQLRSLIINPNPFTHPRSEIHRSEESKQAFQRAAEIAESKENNLVLPEYLLQAILEPINSPLADNLAQLGLPDLYEQIFRGEIDNDDRLRREALRSLLKQIGKSDVELQDLLISHPTSNPYDNLEILQKSGDDNPKIREKIHQAGIRALEELTQSPKVQKIITEISIDALIVVFAPLGIAVKAIKILLEKSELKDNDR